MLHQNVEAIISELVLTDGELLQADVILKHLAKVYSHRLAYRLVDRIVDIELFQRVVARV